MTDFNIPNYTLIKKIGEGGMGDVYLAEHKILKRKAAVKILHQDLVNNPDLVVRFHNEAVTLSRLSHPDIVTIYDFLEHDKNLYIIMEYVEGITMDEVIRKSGRIEPIDRCIKVFCEVLNGFSYAHRNGIIHRDIKPSNIMLLSDDGLKILDFGIAKIMQSDNRLTRTGTKMGSILYMSPEQVKGQDVDYRSDIYSLGVTFFEMLTGKLPYENYRSDYEIQNDIVLRPLPNVNMFNPNVPNYIQNVISKATAKNPEDRFQSCEEFQQALLSANQISYRAEPTRAPYNAVTPSVQQNVVIDGTSKQNKSNKDTTILIVSIAALALIMVIVIIAFITAMGSFSENLTENLKTEKNKIQNYQQTLPETEKRNELSQNQTGQTDTYGVPGVYPEASLRELSVNELLKYSKSELRLMRNEIYARHGRKFKSPDLINYFNSQSWYTPLYTDYEVQYMLTNIEKKNIMTIQQAEKLVR